MSPDLLRDLIDAENSRRVTSDPSPTLSPGLLRWTHFSHLRYLYVKNGDALLAWALFIVPSVAMIAGTTASSYYASVDRFGTLWAGAMAAIVSLVTVFAGIVVYTEILPPLPLQALLARKVLRTPAGIAMIVFAALIAYMVIRGFYEMWSHERAASIPYMPLALALLCFGATIIWPSLLVGIHQLPWVVYQRLAEFDQVDDLQVSMDTSKSYYIQALTVVAQIRAKGRVTKTDRAVLGLLSARIAKDLHTLQTAMLKEITTIDPYLSNAIQQQATMATERRPTTVTRRRSSWR